MSFPSETLDPNDLWFLEAAAELRTPLRLLMGREAALALNMPRPHGLSREALGAKLTSLSDRGLIRIHSAQDESVLAQTHAEIDLAWAKGKYSEPGGFIYGLTPRGGELWERYARPDWSRYSDSTVGYQPDVGVIEAISLEAAEAVYQRHERGDDEYEPLAESKQGEVLVPWQATYWKTLPTGYRLRYEWMYRRHGVLKPPPEPPPPPWYSSAVLKR